MKTMSSNRICLQLRRDNLDAVIDVAGPHRVEGRPLSVYSVTVASKESDLMMSQ